MRAKKKVLLLGPAHPYRGGIADTQNYLAQNISRLGHDVLVLLSNINILNYFSQVKLNTAQFQRQKELILKEKFIV